MPTPDAPLPDLKTDPKYGHYPWWPEDGDGWLHPDDVEAARSLIPSGRIWRREGETEEGYLLLRYGELTLRVRRTLWREAPFEGYELGDLVEVLPLGMTNEPRTGVVRERLWNESGQFVEYCLTLGDGTLCPQRYRAGDLKHVEPPANTAEVQYKPVADDGEELELE